MKQLVKITAIIILALFTSDCAGGKEMQFEKDPPFQIASAYTQQWVAGVQGGGSGTHIHITLENVVDGVIMKNVYYSNKVETLIQDSNKPAHYYANVKDNLNRDIIMDADPSKEAKNTPPQKLPFELGADEIAISYMVEGLLKYYKISQVEVKPMLAYPTTNNPNTDQ